MPHSNLTRPSAESAELLRSAKGPAPGTLPAPQKDAVPATPSSLSFESTPPLPPDRI